jgi:hypothetical protein
VASDCADGDPSEDPRWIFENVLKIAMTRGQIFHSTIDFGQQAIIVKQHCGACISRPTMRRAALLFGGRDTSRC